VGSFVLVSGLVFCAHAQEFRATVQGVVTDSSQAVVVGATVTLANVKTGIQSAKQSNENGRYRFDYVDPGSYTITVESPGFAKFVQANIEAQALADITVNAVLKTGDVHETVTVLETPVAVNFNSTNMVLTVDTKLATELPRLDRNPFKLDLLNPAVRDTRRNEMMPYHSWAANSTELGGGTDKKNDLQVDGSPIGSGYKASYVPNSDAVQEVNVQQNAVDAESGHSAGGAISMTLKSGTNEFHGGVFYLGRNPALNAVTDRTTNTFTAARNNMWGGSIGHPIRKNKVFNFFSYEQWKNSVPSAFLGTMPTDLERQGDFSHSLNVNGGLRTIYDPYTTTLDAGGNVVRAPFAGNKIPASQFDPIAVRVMKDLYSPNRTPDNLAGLNNFADTTVQRWNYWNISDKVDWFVNDKLRVYGRFSRLETHQDTTASILTKSEAYVPGGSLRNAWTYAGDAVWTASPNTVVNFHYTKQGLDDDFYAPAYDLTGKGGLATIWPNNSWYTAYKQSYTPQYFPQMNIGSSVSLGRGNGWFQHPGGYSFSGKVSHQMGPHFLKMGGEFRHSGGISVVGGGMAFAFNANLTANTFLNPNTRLVGDEFATLLLGALNNDSAMSIKPNRGMETELYGGYIQDDYKLSRRITLNLGLRYEFDTPWHDPDHNSSVGLDLTQINQAVQQNPPKLPAQVTALRTAAPVYNGAWVFTDSSHSGIWESQKTVFMPRIGLALRIDDRTALRLGWARYVSPSELNFVLPPYAALGNVSFLEAPLMGFDATQSPLPLAQGVPQATLSNPFTSANPLIPPPGKSYGQNYGLGEANIAWANQNFKRLVNDRINLTISRQFPAQVVAEVTMFLNFGRDVAYAYNLNQVDPRITYANPSQMDVSVANPFYQYLTSSQFPGPLRNQPTVAVKTVLLPYPQYGGLWEAYRNDGLERYHALQVKVQRPFRGGYNFLFGYNYRREISTQYYDDVAAYLNKLTWQDSNNPRHSMTFAGSYEFPFGKGRAHLQNLPRIAEGVLGGWHSTGAWYFNSGDYLRFGSYAALPGAANVIAYVDPALSNPTPQKWFDTTQFKVLPAYTPRTNPLQYPDVKGPVYWEIQANLAKNFNLTEKVRAELKVAAYNLTNRLNRADPIVDITNSGFGTALRQGANFTGRQMEFGLKILF
jgi:hypothetical protein